MTTISAPEVTPSPTAPPRRRTGWLAGLSVLLLVVGLGVGFLVGRVTKPDTPLPPDIAGPTVTQVLDDFVQAFNEGSATKMADLLAVDATFTDTTKDEGYTVEGGTIVAQFLASLGFDMAEPGTALQNPPDIAVEGGDYVVRYNRSIAGDTMAVYLVANGTIRHIWIVRP